MEILQSKTLHYNNYKLNLRKWLIVQIDCHNLYCVKRTLRYRGTTPEKTISQRGRVNQKRDIYVVVNQSSDRTFELQIFFCLSKNAFCWKSAKVNDE